VDHASLLARLREAGAPVMVLLEDPAGEPASVALVPGSFDPLTVGHAALSEAAAAREDLVVLVYSARTLPKEGPGAGAPLLGEADRLEVLRRFCRGRLGMVPGVCSHGLLADQVAAAAARFPGARLTLVVGSDKVLQLLDPRWYGDRDAALEGLFARAEVRFAVRAGEEGAVEEALARPENRRWRGRFSRLEVPPEVAAVSSRAVRELLRRGEDVRGLVPPEVHPFLGPRSRPPAGRG
jgi:nicotinamide-nucleotide adenylyltransferase